MKILREDLGAFRTLNRLRKGRGCVMTNGWMNRTLTIIDSCLSAEEISNHMN